MRVDNLSRFELQSLGRFLLQHVSQDTRRRLMVELPVVYRKLLDRPVTEEFCQAIKSKVLEDTPAPCACGQAFTTEAQLSECKKTEALRLLEEANVRERELEQAMEELEEDE